MFARSIQCRQTVVCIVTFFYEGSAMNIIELGGMVRKTEIMVNNTKSGPSEGILHAEIKMRQGLWLNKGKERGAKCGTTF